MLEHVKKEIRSLVLFQRDLRLKDQIALSKAISESDKLMLCAVFDPYCHKLPLESPKIENERFNLRMRLSAIQTLINEASYHNISISPFIGDTQQLVVALVETYDLNRVYLNVVYEPNFLKCYHKLELELKKMGVELKGFKDHEAVSEASLRNKQGEPYKVFTPYYKMWQSNLSEAQLSPWPIDIERIASLQIENQSAPLIDETADYLHDEPSDYLNICKEKWSELIFKPFELNYDDIEEQFETFLSHKVGQYEQNRDFPSYEGTSSLSAYLNNGLISYRNVVLKTWQSKGAASFLRQLAWRHFYMLILFYFPISEYQAFVSSFRELPWENSQEHIQAWKEGTTGIPIVDAAMRQLAHEGKMHNRLRMISASVLVKQLDVNWQIGEQYFYEKLQDGDLALNNGGWQWCASTGTDAQPYFRIFNPVKQAQTYDPQEVYMRNWLGVDYGNNGLNIDLKTTAERAKLKYKIAKKGVDDHEKNSY